MQVRRASADACSIVVRSGQQGFDLPGLDVKKRMILEQVNVGNHDHAGEPRPAVASQADHSRLGQFG